MNFVLLHLWNPVKVGGWGFVALNVTAGTTARPLIQSKKKPFCIKTRLRTKKSPVLSEGCSWNVAGTAVRLALLSGSCCHPKPQCLYSDCQTWEQLSSACKGLPTFSISHEAKYNSTILPSSPMSFWALLFETMNQRNYELIIAATPLHWKEDPSGKKN